MSRQKTTFIPLLISISVTIFLFAASLFIYKSEESRLLKEERRELRAKADALHDRLEAGVYSRLFLTRGLAAFVAINNDISELEFNKLAKELINDDPVISSISLAKDSVITYIYPYVGHESAIGLDLMAHPERKKLVEMSIKTGKTYLQGPVELVEGGIAFISYSPIYTSEDRGRNSFWGLADVVIFMDNLLEEAGLTRGLNGLDVALRGKDGQGSAGEIFFGSEKIFTQDPILIDIFLPIGSWQMAAMPAGGWSSPFEKLRMQVLLGAIISFFGGAFVFILMYESSRLRGEIESRIMVENKLVDQDKELKKYRESLELRVKERTSELEKKNEELKSEIEERKQVQEELRKISRRVLTAQEEERKRLSRELHDGLGQTLLATKLKLQMSSGEDKQAILTDMSASIEELRNISAALRPPMLEDSDMSKLVLWYVDQFREYSDIEIIVDSEEGINMAPLVIDNLYRVLQEALGNITKHSCATKVQVSLKRKKEFLCLTIQDNGKGFDPIDSQHFSDGIGLSTMKERVELLGGIFTVEASNKVGTLIKVEVPLK